MLAYSGFLQVGPVLRDVLDDVGVHDEGENAVIVAVPVAVGVLGGVRNRVPGGDLVGLDQAVGLGGRAEGEADVDDVRSLRAGVALVGLDGFDFVARTGIRVQFVDFEAVLGLEAGNDVAIAAPVVRESDGRQRAFLLGGGDEFGARFCSGDRGRSHDHRSRKRKQSRNIRDHWSFSFWFSVSGDAVTDVR